MRQRIESALFKIMACPLFGVKPLPETMLNYFQLDVFWLPATINRIISVYGFIVVITLLMYSVLHYLYSVRNKITASTIWGRWVNMYSTNGHWDRNILTENRWAVCRVLPVLNTNRRFSGMIFKIYFKWFITIPLRAIRCYTRISIMYIQSIHVFHRCSLNCC